MKKVALGLLFLSLAGAVATVPVCAQTLYNNFTQDSDTKDDVAAYGIFGGNAVTDSFSLGSSATVTGVTIDYWVNQGYPTNENPMTSINWSFGTSPFGTQDGSGTASPTSYTYLNTYYDTAGYYEIYSVTIPVSSATLGSETTYWFTLGNASSPAGNSYWDASYGLSTAYWDSNTTTAIPSSTFKLFGSNGPTPVPEASPFDLPVVIGALGMVLLLSRKRIVALGDRRTS